MIKNGTILLLDQDSELVSILAAFLSSQGYQVVFTTRVREALKKIRSQKFAHILVDPELKKDNSITVLHELNEINGLNAKTPLSLMTFNDKYLLPISLAKRLHSLMIKPFTLEEFAFRVGPGKGESQN